MSHILSPNSLCFPKLTLLLVLIEDNDTFLCVCVHGRIVGKITLVRTEKGTGAREQVGCMKLCGSFHITPEPGHGPRPIVPNCSPVDPCCCLGLGSSQCVYAHNGNINLPADCTVQPRLFRPVALRSLLICQCEHKPDLPLLKSFKFKTLKVNSHVTFAFAFFFDLCHPVLENTKH